MLKESLLKVISDTLIQRVSDFDVWASFSVSSVIYTNWRYAGWIWKISSIFHSTPARYFSFLQRTLRQYANFSRDEGCPEILRMNRLKQKRLKARAYEIARLIKCTSASFQYNPTSSTSLVGYRKFKQFSVIIKSTMCQKDLISVNT